MNRRTEILICVFVTLPIFEVFCGLWPKITFIWWSLVNWRVLLLLSCLPCAAQFGGFTDQPFFAGAPAVAALPSGIRHRWKASDLAASPVDTWTDSVSGWNWTGSGGTRPTRDSAGVTFDGVDDFLTVTNMTSATTSSNNWLFVCKLNALGVFQTIMGDAIETGQVFMYVNNTNYLYPLSPPFVGPLNTNVVDFLVCQTTNASPYVVFTNGISGYVGAWWDSTLTRVGNTTLLPTPLNGTIKEVIVWTNKLFTVADVAAIHRYCTNAYSFSP